jgi:hypothetical protein
MDQLVGDSRILRRAASGARRVPPAPGRTTGRRSRRATRAALEARIHLRRAGLEQQQREGARDAQNQQLRGQRSHAPLHTSFAVRKPKLPKVVWRCKAAERL